jgi:hypothetical protein
MRIVRRSGLTSAVVRVRTSREVVVAIPAHLPAAKVLALARLVLSRGEYEQLRRALQPARDRTNPMTP